MGKKILILAILILVVYFSNAVHYKYFSNTGYIEKTTKINLPFWTSTIETYDNGEFAVIGKYKISKSKIMGFCKGNEIKLESETNYCQLTFVDYLSNNNRPDLQDLKNCLFYTDCNGAHSWRLLINKITGETWIEVSYPDMSGDTIPCDK